MKKDDFKKDLAERFFKGYLIADEEKNTKKSYFNLLYCIWVCDDAEDIENARKIRKLSIGYLDELIEIASGSFKGLVHPSDYRRVRESIDQQIIENHNDLSEFVKYRIFTKNGLTKDVMEFGRLTRSNYYGDVYYILLVDQDMLSLDQDYL